MLAQAFATTKSNQGQFTVVKGIGIADHSHTHAPSPATPLKRRGKVIGWQLQFDFDTPIAPVSRPILQPQKVKPPRKNARPKVVAQPVDLNDGKKRNRLQVLKVLSTTESDTDKELRLQKGIQDRKAFLAWIERGIAVDEHGNNKGPVYARFKAIARSEIVRALNKSQSLRGKPKHEEEDIWMDFYHDTITKVATALEDGLFEAVDNRFDNYFWGFLTKDASRYVQKLDAKNMIHKDIYATPTRRDDGETRDIFGDLGLRLSESPDFMEGRLEEFRSFAFSYIMDYAEYALRKNEDDLLDSHMFRMYYGTRDTLTKIAMAHGYSENKVRQSKERVKEYIKAHIKWEQIWHEFGMKIMEGCKPCNQ